MKVPDTINGFQVVEYGYFPQALLPTGYIVPLNGEPTLEMVENVAISWTDAAQGYYIFFCTMDWQYVTFSFNETLEYTRRIPMREFGHDVVCWL